MNPSSGGETSTSETSTVTSLRDGLARKTRHVAGCAALANSGCSGSGLWPILRIVVGEFAGAVMFLTGMPEDGALDTYCPGLEPAVPAPPCHLAPLLLWHSGCLQWLLAGAIWDAASLARRTGVVERFVWYPWDEEGLAAIDLREGQTAGTGVENATGLTSAGVLCPV